MWTMMAMMLAAVSKWITDGPAEDIAATKPGQSTSLSAVARPVTASHPLQASAMAVIMDCTMHTASGQETFIVSEANRVRLI